MPSLQLPIIILLMDTEVHIYIFLLHKNNSSSSKLKVAHVWNLGKISVMGVQLLSLPIICHCFL